MIVEFRRGSFVESSHVVHARLETASGRVLYNSSDEDFAFMPRSAVKPLQARPLIQSGAYEALKLTPQHLALACASHSGQLLHTRPVQDWLARLGLNADNLQCGAHWPLDKETSAEMIKQGEGPTRIHNNCSGKHTGFLSVCCHCGWSVEDYHQPEHPIQVQIRETLESYVGHGLTSYGVDGCSIPAYQMGFASLTQGLAKFASEVATSQDPVSSEIYRAFCENPELTAGREEYCTRMMLENSGRILIKEGAEGVMAGVFPEQKHGLLVKVQDGAERAGQAAFDYLAQKFLGLRPVYPRTLRNWGGVEVGDIQFRL